MKKIIFTVILVSAVFAPAVFAQRQTEVWRDVTSRNELIGRWEGSVIQSIPRNEGNSIPETLMGITFILEYTRITENVNLNLKIDMNQFLTDFIEQKEIKSTGLTKNDLWETLSGLFYEIFRNIYEDVNIGKYYVSLNISVDAGSNEGDDVFQSENGKFQINAAGNKLRLMFFDEISFGLGDSNIKEIILDKKSTTQP